MSEGLTPPGVGAPAPASSARSADTGPGSGHTGTMTERFSAGVLLYRTAGTDIEILLGHMGGPLWSRKDTGAWSVPKGEYEVGAEDPAAAAAREFTEELGLPVPPGPWTDLGDVRYRSGRGAKTLRVWAVRGDLDPALVVPGTFEMEWPPRSGTLATFPEIDRVGWFGPDVAVDKLVTGQRPFLARLTALLDPAAAAD